MRRRARIAVGESQSGATGQLQVNVCAGNVGRCKRTEANNSGGDERASVKDGGRQEARMELALAG